MDPAAENPRINSWDSQCTAVFSTADCPMFTIDCFEYPKALCKLPLNYEIDFVCFYIFRIEIGGGQT